MKFLKHWFSSKLLTKDGRYEEADKYAYSVDLYRDFAEASIEIGDQCYIRINDDSKFSAKQRMIGDSVIVDYDADGNVLGVEILVPCVIEYEERRD